MLKLEDLTPAQREYPELFALTLLADNVFRGWTPREMRHYGKISRKVSDHLYDGCDKLYKLRLFDYPETYTPAIPGAATRKAGLMDGRLTTAGHVRAREVISGDREGKVYKGFIFGPKYPQDYKVGPTQTPAKRHKRPSNQALRKPYYEATGRMYTGLDSLAGQKGTVKLPPNWGNLVQGGPSIFEQPVKNDLPVRVEYTEIEQGSQPRRIFQEVYDVPTELVPGYYTARIKLVANKKLIVHFELDKPGPAVFVAREVQEPAKPALTDAVKHQIKTLGWLGEKVTERAKRLQAELENGGQK